MLDPDQKVERKERTRNIKTFLPEEGENYVFISYKSDDWKNVLIDIVEAMQERYGLRVYYDANFDKDNDLWIDNMKSAIKSSRCKAILAFISKGYMESYACLMELLYSKTFEVKMIHDDQEVPIIPILINGLNGIDYALSNKSEELKVKEWDVYAKLLEQAIDSDLDKKITRAIKGLRDSAHKASIEQMSRVMRYLLDGNHERTWTEKSKDVFMENLYDTLSHIAPSRDDKVFDSTLIRNAASQEEQKNRQTAETDTTSSRKLPAKSAEPSEAEPVKRRPGRPKAEKPNANGKSEKAGQPQKSKPASGTLKELLEKNKISVGTEIYIEGYPNSEAVITEEDKVLFKGNQRTIKEYIDFASGMRLTKQEPLSVIFEKNSGRSLLDLLNEEEAAEKPEATSKEVPEKPEGKKKDGKKRTDEKVEFTPEEVTPVEKTRAGEITIGEVRKRLSSDLDFLIKLTDIRQKGLPFGGKSYMDYAMAAILNGCNNLKEDYQFNYYRYAIANRDNKKESAKTEATWTWSSNARKVVGYVSAGMLPVQINNCFTELPETTTVNDLIRKFEACDEEPFITKKNNMVIFCLQKFIEGYHD